MGKVRPHQATLAGKKKLEETSCICFFETLQTLTARLALNQDLRNRNGFISAFGDLVFLKKCKGYKQTRAKSGCPFSERIHISARIRKQRL